MSTSEEAFLKTEGPPLDRISFRRFSDQLLEIATTNACLSALTFGIYRFWGKTNLRRHFWNRVYVYGDPLEYTGTGKELLFGFLTALVIIAPFYSLYRFGPSLVDQTSLGSQIALGIFYAAAITFVVFLYHFAVFRAFRYRLSRTRWRGIAAGLNGSSWSYAKAGLFYSFLTAISLGIAYPLQTVALFKKRVEAAYLGSVSFRFDGIVKPLFWRWIFLWIPLGVMTGIALFIVMNYLKSIEPLLQSGAKAPDPSPYETKAMIALPLLYMAGIVGYFWYRVERVRYFMNHLHIAGIDFKSEFKFLRLILAAVLYGLATLVVIFPLLLIISSVLHFAFAKNAIAAYIGIGVMMLLAYGISSFFYTVLFLHPMTRHFFDSFKTKGTPDFAAIAQRPTQEKPRYGEGLADILDIGAF